MSATRAATEANVRLLIDDSNPQQYAVSSLRLHQIVQGEMQLVGARMFLPMEAVLAVTLVAGTYDYTLTGMVGDIRQVVRDSDGRELYKTTLEDMVAHYKQDSATPSSSGTPTEYAAFETAAQLSRIRVGPTPDESGTLDVYYGVVPASLTTDASTIPFSAPLLRALEKLCAAECVTIMSREDRAMRMVNSDAAGLWREMAEQAIREENGRMRLMGSGTQPVMIETDR